MEIPLRFVRLDTKAAVRGVWLGCALMVATWALAGPAGGATGTTPTSVPASRPATRSAGRPATAATTAPATAPTTRPATRPAPLATRPVDLATAATLDLSPKAIAARIKETTSRTDLDQATRDSIIGLYDQALASMKRAEESAALAGKYDQDAIDAPLQAQRLREAATQPATGPAEAVPAGLGPPEMEARLKKLELDQAELKKKTDALDEEMKARPKRLADLPKFIDTMRDRIKESREKLDAVRTSTERREVKIARFYQLMAQRKAAEARMDLLNREQATFEVRGELLRAQQEFFARQAQQLQASVQAWQKAVGARRDAEARRQAEEARRQERQAEGQHSLVRENAAFNTYLAELRTGPHGLNEKRQGVAAEQGLVESRLKRLDDSFEKAKRMVGEAAMTGVIGLYLRNERAQLPNTTEQRLASMARQTELTRAKIEQYRWSEKLAELSDVGARAKALVAQARPPVPPQAVRHVEAALRSSLADTKKYLEPLVLDHEKYFNELVKLDTEENRLIRRSEEFADYIDQRVLWIRSTWPLGSDDAERDVRVAGWFLDGGNWRLLASELWANAKCAPARTLLGLLAILALLAGRPKLVSVLRLIGRSVSDAYPGKLGQTFLALLISVLLAVAGPAVLWLMGWVLSSGGAQEGDFAYSVGRGLMLTACAWLPGALVVQICRKQGLAGAHFHWPEEPLRKAARSLRWLMMVALPLLFVVATLEFQRVEGYKETLGRSAAIVGLVLLGGWVAKVFWPGGAMFGGGGLAGDRSWLRRLRLLWYPLVVLLPLWLAGSAAMGYYYTTIQLSWRMLLQFWAVIALLVLDAMLARWFLIARIALAGRRRQQRAAESQAAGHAGGAGESPTPAGTGREAGLQEAAVDLTHVGAQTRQFVRYLVAVMLVGSVWMIWADVLPALGMLREVQLWTVTTPAGPIPVTLADLGAAIIILVLTVVASRNLPGILEVTVLQRLRMDAGSRYAANTLARYAIVALGVVFTAEAVGVKWAHLQWLLAAMSLGLGFGLQEIFANFVSGLIILFERPIRVGDVVTVGGVTGTVSRIRIRATTITDLDRKELLVPNKEFITSQLVNWTLSDDVIRLVIPVGIAYGNDTRLARELLLKAARDHARVLASPPPEAFLLGFGDNSLNFELRVYVAGQPSMMPVSNDLHMAIDEAFRQAHIEIAFPQRDIHIRSIDAAIPLTRGKSTP
jgi:potassium efflux system protein